MADTEQPRYMNACAIVDSRRRRICRGSCSPFAPQPLLYVWDLLADKLDERVGVVQKKLLDESGKDRLVALTDKMVKKADVRWLVTAEMI